MSDDNEEVIKVLLAVLGNRNVRVCSKQSGEGLLVSGAMCLAGGLLMGSRGYTLGGIVGELTASAMSDNFETVGDVLTNGLTDSQEEELVRRIKRAVANSGDPEMCLLTALVTNPEIQTNVVKTVKSFMIDLGLDID